MKKLMFIMMMLLGFVATSSSVYAQSVSVQSAEDIEGSYTGSLTKVYMNGDKSPVSPIVTVVTSNGDGTYNFSDLAGGFAANNDCLITHDQSALYFSGKELFPVETSQQDRTIVKNSLSLYFRKPRPNC